MTTNLLIGVMYLVIGVGIMALGIGGSYFIYRRNRDDAGDVEYGENRRERIQNWLEEDQQFVVFALAMFALFFIDSFVSRSAAIFYFVGLLTMGVLFRIADDEPEDDAVEGGKLEVADGQDAEDLRAFVDAVEHGEIEANPGVNAAVRIVRSLLDDAEDAGGKENMTGTNDHARARVFESPDGTTRTLHQIAYYGWKEGGDVEQDGDDFIVDGTRYTQIDNGGES